jgi:copper resistance protein B
MRTKIVLVFLLTLAASSIAKAEDDAHGTQVFDSFRLDVQTGVTRREGSVQIWDFSGWVGTDENRLWLQSEGERLDGMMEDAEFWALYSRNIATFWDAQIGIRQDVSPHPDTYLTMGFTGLAPYFFETQAHVFISDKGYVSARLREENDLLITQKLITKPYAQIDMSFANDVQQQRGSGVSKAGIGIQTRYEFSRKFAPYFDLRYERAFGNTIGILQQDSETGDDFIASVGLRLIF